MGWAEVLLNQGGIDRLQSSHFAHLHAHGVLLERSFLRPDLWNDSSLWLAFAGSNNRTRHADHHTVAIEACQRLFDSWKSILFMIVKEQALPVKQSIWTIYPLTWLTKLILPLQSCRMSVCLVFSCPGGWRRLSLSQWTPGRRSRASTSRAWRRPSNCPWSAMTPTSRSSTCPKSTRSPSATDSTETGEVHMFSFAHIYSCSEILAKTRNTTRSLKG